MGEFSEIKSVASLVLRGCVRPAMQTPWPRTPGGGFVWLLRHGADRWVPTVVEQDEAYEAVHRPQRAAGDAQL